MIKAKLKIKKKKKRTLLIQPPNILMYIDFIHPIKVFKSFERETSKSFLRT